MHNVLLSVIMSEYNTDVDNLRESINSILNQTYKNFELIIIDDCGKNNLSEIVSEFKDDRIIVVKNEANLGLALSLNKGIEMAKGKYIVRMDTDDISFPERFEKQLNFFENHQDYSILGTRYVLFDDNGEYDSLGKAGIIEKLDFIRGTPFCHPSLMIRKVDIVNSGLYPNYRRVQDYAMEMQMYACGCKGYIMDDILLKYREDRNSYKKKKYKYRIMEFNIRKKYFKKLKMPFYSYIYLIKPLIVGLVPGCIVRRIHKQKGW